MHWTLLSLNLVPETSATTNPQSDDEEINIVPKTMQQLAEEANPDAPPPVVVPKMTASENRLPLHDRIKFNMEIIQAHLDKWKSKGHLQLKPDCLSWTPFLVTRGPHQEITAAMNSKDPQTAPTNALRDGQSPVEILDIDKEQPTVVDKDGLEIDIPDPARSSTPEANVAPLVVVPGLPQEVQGVNGSANQESTLEAEKAQDQNAPEGDVEMDELDAPGEPDTTEEPQLKTPPPVSPKVNGSLRVTRQSPARPPPVTATVRSSPRRGQQAPQSPSNARPAQLSSASKLKVNSPRSDKSRRIFPNGRKSSPIAHSSDDSDLEDEMRLKPGFKNSDLSDRRKLRSPSGFARSLSVDKATPSAGRRLPIRTRDSSSLDEDEQDLPSAKKARFADSAEDSQSADQADDA